MHGNDPISENINQSPHPLPVCVCVCVWESVMKIERRGLEMVHLSVWMSLTTAMTQSFTEENLRRGDERRRETIDEEMERERTDIEKRESKQGREGDFYPHVAFKWVFYFFNTRTSKFPSCVCMCLFYKVLFCIWVHVCVCVYESGRALRKPYTAEWVCVCVCVRACTALSQAFQPITASCLIDQILPVWAPPVQPSRSHGYWEH